MSTRARTKRGVDDSASALASAVENPRITSPSKRSRGRGRGNSRGGVVKQSAAEKKPNYNEKLTQRQSPRGRGRGRAKSISIKGYESEAEEKIDSDDSDDQPLSELKLKYSGDSEGQHLSELKYDDDDDLDDRPLSELKLKHCDPNLNTSKEADRNFNTDMDDAPSNKKVKLDANVVNDIESNQRLDIPSETTALDELASQLSQVPDDCLDDKVILSEEQMKQLESVLSSDEGLKMFDDAQSADGIAGLSLDESILRESLNVNPLLTSFDDSAGIMSESLDESREEEHNDQQSSERHPSPRRKSERVTDIERRSMAEKIRQENNKKEKEMLAELVSKQAENNPTKAISPVKAAKLSKPVDEKSPKGLGPGKNAKKKGNVKKDSVTLQVARSNDSTKSINDLVKDVSGEGKAVQDTGWIPGKVKVINRQSLEKEEEKTKRKSLEEHEKSRRLSSVSDLFKPDEPKRAQRRERKKKRLGDDEVSGGEGLSDEEEPDSKSAEDSDDKSWVEEDDPERLWCVCRKPHDDRFMICCDRCEEWYHGDCVGITRKRGQQMEVENEEYICSLCKEKELLEKLGGMDHATASLSLATLSSSDSQSDKNSKIKGEIRKKDPNTTSPMDKKQFRAIQPNVPRQHCIGSGCDNWAEEGRIYCSHACVTKHAKESLAIISKEKNKLLGPSHEVSAGKALPEIVVMERHTGKVVTGAHAPNAENLITWLTRHPTFEVLRPGQRTGHVSAAKVVGKTHSKLVSVAGDDKSQTKKSSKDGSTSNQKMSSTTSTMDNKAVRENAKKGLVDILQERMKEMEDKINNEELKLVAHSVEHELYKYYGDTNNKYKSKYRSLVFNIKDPKNTGLFRKILKRKIKPAKLVRMTTDELASKELHMWREKEIKNELEKIRKEEEMKAAVSAPLRKITHKGEIEVQEEKYDDLEVKLNEAAKDYDMEAFSAKKESLVKSDSNTLSVLSSIMGDGDTTSQHNAHLFDSNCKICTGKQSAPSAAELERQNSFKVKVAHKILTEKPAKSVKIQETPKEDPDKVVKDLQEELVVFEAEDKKIEEQLENRRKLIEARRNSKQEKPTVPSPVITREARTPPLSTMPSPKTDSKVKSVWKGFIDVPEVSKFFCNALPVHGSAESLKQDLPDCLQVVGRIHHNQVWEYLGQLKHTASREVILIRFKPANEDEEEGYIKYFTYLSEKKRFGVVGNGASAIKDMYVIPLPNNESLPDALKPYRHKVLAADNRKHMLLGLIVRSKQKKPSSIDEKTSSKKVYNPDDEPYEPPGMDDIKADEPVTPPVTATTPKQTSVDEDEYDPTSPVVKNPRAKAEDDMDTDSYDPIVSAYSLADDHTLNAEDVPGAEAYSPTQDEEDLVKEEKSYVPSEALKSKLTTKKDSKISEILDQKSTSLNEKEMALQQLMDQIEQHKRQLELQKSQISAGLPQTIADIMTGKSFTNKQADPEPLNYMEYLKRTIAASSVDQNRPNESVNLPQLLSPTNQNAMTPERTKISFSINSPEAVSSLVKSAPLLATPVPPPSDLPRRDSFQLDPRLRDIPIKEILQKVQSSSSIDSRIPEPYSNREAGIIDPRVRDPYPSDPRNFDSLSNRTPHDPYINEPRMRDSYPYDQGGPDRFREDLNGDADRYGDRWREPNYPPNDPRDRYFGDYDARRPYRGQPPPSWRNNRF